MTLLEERKSNYLYAPGIATYGIDGKDGDNGQNGNSIFYSNYDIETNFSNFLLAIKNDLLLLTNSTESLSRSYIDGDYVLFNTGKIYRLHNIEAINDIQGTDVNVSDYLEFVGDIKNSDNINYFKINGVSNLILDPSYNGLTIGDDASQIDPEYILNIISSNQNKEQVIKLLSCIAYSNLINSDSLSLDYDTRTSEFYVKSTKPLMIDSAVIELQDNTGEDPLVDNYSKVITQPDSMTSFYNAAKVFNTINYTTPHILNGTVIAAKTLEKIFGIDRAISVCLYDHSGKRTFIECSIDTENGRLIAPSDSIDFTSYAHISILKYNEVFVK